MAIDFPASPSVNDTHTVGSTTWTWDGTKWTITSGGGSGSQWTTTGSDIYYDTGRVGMGTSAPDSPVHIYGTGQVFPRVQTTSTTNDAGWKFKNGTREWGIFVNGGDGALRFYDETAAAERMRISNNGTLSVYGPADSPSVNFSVSHGPGTHQSLAIYSGGSSTTSLGTKQFYVQNNGDVRNTNNSYGAISDVKLKENITDANSQWNDLKALQVRNYNFKENQTHTQIGLIAQEVELVSPGLVSESPDRDEDGNDLGTVTKSVNYSVLYMKAVKALQEAQLRIETLEAQNADILARLTALEGGTP